MACQPHLRSAFPHAYQGYACVSCVPGSPRYPHPLTRLCVWRLPPVGHLLGGSTDTGSTDTQGPRDGNAGKKSSRSRMRGLLDWRKPRSRGRMPGSRQANGNKARQPPAQATQPRAAGPNVYGDSEFHLPPPLSTGNAQVWSHRSAAVSCHMPCSCSSAPSPVPSGPR